MCFYDYERSFVSSLTCTEQKLLKSRTSFMSGNTTCIVVVLLMTHAYQHLYCPLVLLTSCFGCVIFVFIDKVFQKVCLCHVITSCFLAQNTGKQNCYWFINVISAFHTLIKTHKYCFSQCHVCLCLLNSVFVQFQFESFFCC